MVDTLNSLYSHSHVTEGGEGEEDGPAEAPSCGGYVLHILTIFWKILFAFVPPAEYCNGWLCFWSAITVIGMLTAVIGDVSSHLGCSVGVKDTVTAICLVAMGTSLPDTFASKVAAIQDATADNSVGNVTGSNAVNVFLGIGVAWSIAAIYHSWHGNQFIVPPGNLGFSVMVFCTEALFAIFVLLLRRSNYVGGELGDTDPLFLTQHKTVCFSLGFSVMVFCTEALFAIFVLLLRRSNYVGGELGGPVGIKYLTSAFMFGLWLIYLTLSTLEAYGVIGV
ncbi:Sodium/calcium exchanger 3 [Homalodisca vitripennis]|nr:Sodium/calcium exchanger 3 [Homalodisca vitripennis]